MHGLPPAILDEERPHALIGEQAPKRPQLTRATTLSTGRATGVGTAARVTHARPMTSTVAHLLLAPLLAVVAPGPSPASVSTDVGPASVRPVFAAPAAVPAQLSPVWPLEPRPEIAERFDPPAERWSAGHRGVDLFATPGQRVRAASGGTITFAGSLAGRGVVVVSHGATRTTYEPVRASVRVGEAVRAGQPIGVTELFGSHCWPRSCLHWGLIEGETYLDPLTLVGAGPVRLLPLFSDLPTTGLLGPPIDLLPRGPTALRSAATTSIRKPPQPAPPRT
jgi:murein DD-endopeptidase MepM/ murein hydrolase activator NlpD